MQKIIAVSGYKNSGKTRLIEALLPLLAEAGKRVAVIKHHGHELDPDVPGTDTYRFNHGGAYATVITDDESYMLVRREKSSLEDMIALFADADIIILEGYKESSYPRIEMRRHSPEKIGDEAYLAAVVSDFSREELEDIAADTPVFISNDFESIAKFVLQFTQ